MNWYKKASEEHMNLLMNFYNYLMSSRSNREKLSNEIIYLYHTSQDSSRHKFVRELLSTTLNDINNMFQNFLQIPESFFKYYIKKDPYSSFERLIARINKVKSILDKVNVEVQALDYDSKNNVYKFKKTIDDLNLALWGLGETLKHKIILNNDLEEKIIVQDYDQLKLEGEPEYKEVGKYSKPSWGHGWKVKDPLTGEWDWWKTNWDSSD